MKCLSQEYLGATKKQDEMELAGLKQIVIN